MICSASALAGISNRLARLGPPEVNILECLLRVTIEIGTGGPRRLAEVGELKHDAEESLPLTRDWAPVEDSKSISESAAVDADGEELRELSHLGAMENEFRAEFEKMLGVPVESLEPPFFNVGPEEVVTADSATAPMECERRTETEMDIGDKE